MGTRDQGRENNQVEKNTNQDYFVKCVYVFLKGSIFLGWEMRSRKINWNSK